MKPIQGHHLIKPDDLDWRPSNLMRIPTRITWSAPAAKTWARGSGGCRPRSAATLHRHIRAEEFYFVLEGTGRLRVGDKTLTVPRHGGVLVGPDSLRQIFNDTDARGALFRHRRTGGARIPARLEIPDEPLAHLPVDPKQLPQELAGVEWPPKE